VWCVAENLCVLPLRAAWNFEELSGMVRLPCQQTTLIIGCSPVSSCGSVKHKPKWPNEEEALSQHFIIRSFRFCFLIIVALAVLRAGSLINNVGVFGQPAGQTGSQNLSTLALNQPVEREMAGGEIHSYRLKLEAGQYIKVEVFQYWIDVELRLFDASEKLLIAVDQTE
jgi:hypothetical protein